MTIALPPAMPPPAAPQSRDAAGALGVDAHRPLRASRDAETARALRPVEAAPTAADARLTTRRDQPVGPPPAFAINVLDHLRETAFDPPEPVDDARTQVAAQGAGPDASRPAVDTGTGAARADPAPYDRQAVPEDGVAPRIDFKL